MFTNHIVSYAAWYHRISALLALGARHCCAADVVPSQQFVHHFYDMLHCSVVFNTTHSGKSIAGLLRMWLCVCVYNIATIVLSCETSRTDQCSKVDASVWSKRLYERWSAAPLHIAVVQRQAAEVAVQLQRHRVPAAVVDTAAGDAQHVATIATHASTTAAAEATGQLEPQLPFLQLLTHINTISLMFNLN